ncbi:MAG: B12-binding domain-containing radical SAM protein [Actinomycetia bacterium]|nr:B12-binding domain-containing radical SAM protein [Actinomycetes bacterium]
MRVLLFQAPVSLMSPHAHLSPPLGLAYVATHLLDEGHRVEIIDLNLSGLNPQRVAYALKRFSPDVVGISAHTETYPNALKLARIVKEHDASIPVMVGGPHASILPEAVLQEPDIDFVVIGEGERTAVELMAALEAGGGPEAIRAIAGLGHVEEGRLVLNAPRAPLDPAEVRRPARHLLSLEFYQDAHNVLTARGGCPFRCPFCSASYLWGGKRRPRPPAEIMAELRDIVREYGAQHVFFVDDIFTLNRTWLEELLALLAERPVGVTWGCATRVDLVTEELVQRMAAAGCSGIQFGIESGAQEVLDSVKGIKKDDALDAVRWTVAADMSATCSFMIPFPEDTEETLAETLAFMRVLKDAGGTLLMSYTTPYPGTMFAEKADELGLTILTDDWAQFDAKHVVMETRHLSAARIEDAAAEMARELGMSRSA